MKTRQIVITAVAVALIGGSLFINQLLSSQKKPAERALARSSVKMVKVKPVETGALVSKVDVTGRLVARDKIELFAEVGGLLQRGARPLREGNYFQKGQVLANIDDEEFQLNLLAQKSSLMNQITLMMPDLKTDYPEAFPAWKAYLDGLDIQQPLAPLPEPVSEQDKYYISARNIYNLFYSIQSAEVRADKYSLEAPFSGVVTEATINEGTLVRVGQKLGEFINPYVYEMEAAVNMSELDFVKVGSTVDLTSRELTGSWKGRVVRISNRIDPQTQTVKVFIAVSGKELKEGMYLSAVIEGTSVDDAVEIPRNLLIENREVYVVQDSSLKLQPVKPVLFMTNTVYVRGLEDSMALLNETVIGAFEGMKVGTYRE